jgi:hypothetical protein
MKNDYDLLTAKFESYYRDLHDIKYLCGQAVRTITGKPRKKMQYSHREFFHHVKDFYETGVWDKLRNSLPIQPIEEVDKNAASVIECTTNDILRFLDHICFLTDNRKVHDILHTDDLTKLHLPLEIKNIAELCFAIETTIKQLAAHAQQVHIKMKGVAGGAAARNEYTDESLKKVKSALEGFGGIGGFSNRDNRPAAYSRFSQEKICTKIGNQVGLSPEHVKKLIGKLRKLPPQEH